MTQGWHDVATTRVVMAAGLAGSCLSRSTFQATQAFGKATYRLLDAPVELTPFVTVARDWSRADAFAESGGAAALAVGGDQRHLTTGSAGARVAADLPLGTAGWLVQPHLSLAKLHN